MFYIDKTGCQWNMLPNDYPNPKTVFHYFSLWSKSGLWNSLVRTLHPQERLAEGHDAVPSAIVLDSRSTKVVAKKAARPERCRRWAKTGISALDITSTRRSRATSTFW